MNKDSLEIILVASKKTGILPALMSKISAHGLLYRRCATTELDDKVKLNIICEGKPDCSESKLIESIQAVPIVENVVQIKHTRSSSNKNINKNTEAEAFTRPPANMHGLTKLYPMRANDAITEDVMQIVQDRLSLVFGPVAHLLLKSAANKATCVGELFIHLAKEFKDDEQKQIFLDNVEGLNKVDITTEAKV